MESTPVPRGKVEAAVGSRQLALICILIDHNKRVDTFIEQHAFKFDAFDLLASLANRKPPA